MYSDQVKSKAELNKVLDEYSVGDTVKLKIERGGEILEVPIVLDEKSSWFLLQVKKQYVVSCVQDLRPAHLA